MDYDDYNQDYDEGEAFIAGRRKNARRAQQAQSPYQPRSSKSSGNSTLCRIGALLIIAFIILISKSNSGNDSSNAVGDKGKGSLRDATKIINQDLVTDHDDDEFDDDKFENREDDDDDAVDDDDDDVGDDDDDSAVDDDDNAEYDDDDGSVDDDYGDDDDNAEYDDDDDDDDKAVQGDDDNVNEYNDDDDDDKVDVDDDNDAADDDDSVGDADVDDDDDVGDDDADVEDDDDNVDDTDDGDDDDNVGDTDDDNVDDDTDIDNTNAVDDDDIDDDKVENDDDDDVGDDDDDDQEGNDENVIYDDDSTQEDDDEIINDDDDEQTDDDDEDDDSSSSPLDENTNDSLPGYHIRDEIKTKFRKWDEELRHIVEMDKYHGGEPKVHWEWHPKERKDRFPSVEERVKYYMGEWYNRTVPMYGEEFRKNTYLYQRTTRECELCSRLSVNLFDNDPDKILGMYASGNPHYHIGGDFVDFEILHKEASTQVMMNWGDNIPKVKHEADTMYPVFCKVRHYCEKKEAWGDYENTLCNKKHISTIIWPVNHKRLHSLPFITAENDIPWEEKEAKAMWRGGAPEGGLPDEDVEFDPMETRHIKWKLISGFVNSSLVDAKYTRRDFKKLVKSGSMPIEYIAPRTEMDEQLKNKYMIAIEGNDVSSAIKWMLFSNSVVLSPPFRFDSWSMECFLEPFVHYLPIKPDMSDLIERIEWAESNPDEALKISERATLFVYDLLMSPDAIKENQLVLEGMMERFEENFGYTSKMPLIHPLSHIHSSWHPLKREDRFPSVDTRTRYYMGIWHDKKEPSMGRSTFSTSKAGLAEENDKISIDTAMVASGSLLTECANGDDLNLKVYCEDALPDFDERNMKEIKKKETPIDDSVKVIQFGDALVDSETIPIFGKTRASSNNQNGGGGRAILWPFDYEKEFSFVESGMVEQCDTPFASKIPKLVWRGGPGTNEQKSKSSEFKNRVELVRKSTGDSSKILDAKFLATKERLQLKEDPKNFPREGLAAEPTSEDESRDYLKNILSHRYIIATEDEYRTNPDLKWMFLSQSVVLMAKENRFSSWFMEDFLEPYVHYVPIAADYSDVEEKLKWCEENIEEVEKISERATLFVHDMLFRYTSDRENSVIKFQVMEKYADNFG